jgi:hypothetical protein
MKDRSLPSRKVLYRSRDIIPVPLKVASVSWREHSLLGEAYETPKGGWDVVLEKGEGIITREVHWPRPKVTLRVQARLLSDVEMEATLTVMRGQDAIGELLIAEKLIAAGHQTAWDIEVMDGRSHPLAHPSWARTRNGVLRGLLAERDHRLHRMLEDALESSPGKATSL